MDLPELFLGLISAMPIIRGVAMLTRIRHEISRLATGSPQTSLGEKISWSGGKRITKWSNMV